MPDFMLIAAVAIFGATYAVVAVGKMPVYRIDRAGAALLGASLMVGTGVLTAEEAYRAAIQLNPRLPSALYGLGMALSRQGRPDEARNALSAARDVDASSPFGQAAIEALKGLGIPPR